MALPATIAAGLSWSSQKNNRHGPFPFLEAAAYRPASPAGVGISSQGSFVLIAQSFQASAASTMTAVALMLSKSGSPSDNVILEVRPDNAGVPSSTVLATSTIAGTALTTTATPTRCTLDTAVSLAASTTYWLVVRRSGTVDPSNICVLGVQSSGTYANGSHAIYNGTTWSLDTTKDWWFAIDGGTATLSALYAVLLDKTNNHAEVWRSTDSGDTWSEQDSANHKAISTTAANKIVDAVLSGTTLHILYVNGASTFYLISQFDCLTNTWGTTTTTTSAPVPLSGTNTISAQATAFLAVRANGNYLVLYNGATESVMGTSYRRVKYARHVSGTWTSAVAVDTFVGTQQHADARGAILGSSDRTHLFSTGSSNVGLLQRALTSANVLQATDAPSLIGTDQTLAYSVGTPLAYVDGADTNLVIPTKATTTFGFDLKLARGTSADTVTWATTETPTSTNDPEAVNAPPGAAAADSTTIHLFWPNDADQDIYRNSDAGTGTWGSDVEWKDAITCNGLNAGKITNAIGVLYDDAGTIKYDAYALTIPPVTHLAAFVADSAVTTSLATAVTHPVALAADSTSTVAVDVGVSTQGAALADGTSTATFAATVSRSVTASWMLQRAGKNWSPNPSFETNTTGWTAQGVGATITRDSAQAWIGGWSGRADTPVLNQAGVFHVCSIAGLTVTGVTHVLNGSYRVWLASGVTVTGTRWRIQYSDGAVGTTYVPVIGTSDWQTITLPAFTTDPLRTITQIRIDFLNSTTAAAPWTAWLDGLDVRIDEADADAYIDGAQGEGFAWTGTAHGSTSTRTPVNPALTSTAAFAARLGIGVAITPTSSSTTTFVATVAKPVAILAGSISTATLVAVVAHPAAITADSASTATVAASAIGGAAIGPNVMLASAFPPSDETLTTIGAVDAPHVAQSFQVTHARALAHASVLLRKHGAPTDGVFFEIRTDDDGVPSSTVLTTSATISTSSITTTLGVFDLEFDPPLTLTMATSYWLVASRTGTLSDTDRVSWSVQTDGSLYDDGMYAAFVFYDPDPLAWYPNVNADLWFVVYGTQPEQLSTAAFDATVTVAGLFGELTAASASTTAFAAVVAKPVAFTADSASTVAAVAAVAKPVALTITSTSTAEFAAVTAGIDLAALIADAALTTSFAAAVSIVAALTAPTVSTAAFDGSTAGADEGSFAALSGSSATFVTAVAKPVAVSADSASVATYAAAVATRVALTAASTSTVSLAAGVTMPSAFTAASTGTAAFDAISATLFLGELTASSQATATFAATVARQVALAASTTSTMTIAGVVAREVALTSTSTSTALFTVLVIGVAPETDIAFELTAQPLVRFVLIATPALTVAVEAMAAMTCVLDARPAVTSELTITPILDSILEVV